MFLKSDIPFMDCNSYWLADLAIYCTLYETLVLYVLQSYIMGVGWVTVTILSYM